MVAWQAFQSAVCFLMVAACLGQDLFDIEGYSNDSPFNEEPKIENMRVKEGTPITLKCVNHISNHTIWEYKECNQYIHKGIVCNKHDFTSSKTTKQNDTWKRRSKKQRLEIDPSMKNDSALYRCLERGVVKKYVIVEVVASDGYNGTPPTVQSLLTWNITNQLNKEFTIQCNVTSIILPTIIWFKKCYGSKCDIDYDDICYCHINVSTSTYNIGNTYINKMNIFNARAVDSGLYACLAVTEYGKDYKYVTITVPDTEVKRNGSSAFPLLFLIPLALVVAPMIVWLCYFRRKKRKKVVNGVEANGGTQQQTLLGASISRGSTRPVK